MVKIQVQPSKRDGSYSDQVYLYRISSTGYSSKRYGACEVCGEHVTEVHLQTESVRKPEHLDRIYGTGKSWFGHPDCLINVRHLPHEIEPPRIAGTKFNNIEHYYTVKGVK